MIIEENRADQMMIIFYVQISKDCLFKEMRTLCTIGNLSG